MPSARRFIPHSDKAAYAFVPGRAAAGGAAGCLPFGALAVLFFRRPAARPNGRAFLIDRLSGWHGALVGDFCCAACPAVCRFWAGCFSSLLLCPGYFHLRPPGGPKKRAVRTLPHGSSCRFPRRHFLCPDACHEDFAAAGSFEKAKGPGTAWSPGGCHNLAALVEPVLRLNWFCIGLLLHSDCSRKSGCLCSPFAPPFLRIF